MKSILLLSFILLINYTISQNNQSDPFNSTDYVPSVPGWPNPLPFTLYSGYLNLSKPTKALHYVLALSLNNWTTDPLGLWLNGGPGCSSMEGWLSEIGPYVVEDGQLEFNGTLNNWTWINNASYMWIESPAGVGFSYIEDMEGEEFSDAITTADQYQALKSFFAKFPSLQNNDFYISGESYGGIYIPRLAHWIEANQTQYNINLKGILVGNGVANISSLDYTTNLFLYQHQFIPQLSISLDLPNQIISDDLWNDYSNCLTYPNAPSCVASANAINALVNGINAYDIYRYCYNDGVDGDCTTSLGYYFFLNNPAVKEALHVIPTITYQPCNDYIGDVFQMVQNGSYADYQYLINNTNVRILLYSGDTDSVVPLTDTLYWLQNANIKTNGTWSNWTTPDGQIAGFIQKYDGLTLATVNGCGHMVPAWKRSQALTMFNSFVFQLGPFSTNTSTFTSETEEFSSEIGEFSAENEELDNLFNSNNMLYGV